MKNAIKNVLVIAMFLTYGCQSESEKKMEKLTEASEELQALIKAESGKSSDKVRFLNITPGMTRSAYLDSLKSIVKQGKILTNEKGEYQYIFEINDFNIKAIGTLRPEFYKEKLSVLRIPVASPNMSSTSYETTAKEAIKTSLSLLYIEKYGGQSSGHLVTLPGLFGDKDDIIWVYGDNMIKLDTKEDTIIEYSNPALLKESADLVEKESTKVKEKQLSEI